MSNRLHVGKTKNAIYDVVVESVADAKSKLNIGLTQNIWKIRISDARLYREIEPMIVGIFDGCGVEYPDTIEAIYYGAKSVENPTRAQLDTLLAE